MRRNKGEILYLIFVLISSSTYSLAKSNLFKKEGKISFITSQNIYVRFDNTENISVGDTAYYDHNGKYVQVKKLVILT